MQTDYVNLIFCHRPAPVSETVRAMNILIQQNKAFYLGTSERNAQQITKAHLFADREHLISFLRLWNKHNIIYFSEIKLKKNLNPYLKNTVWGLTSFNPLASENLSGKYLDGIPQNSRLALKEYKWLRKRFKKKD